ncbi:replication protein A 70 kDa DNA-binding subunit-like isoform X2 [Daktulosphaira vitifoliae]|uniref:replication protein A 70 kDa DNA-binding subunit-like isoform X2 n=1 Tax=Daktulosphaira vitifoliae TaxID=58002 RepID=UPI0021A9BC41|nr:replication protein A 70 kDa DNA-binding subunit-like isoform X2 [Daktulosphaira vitifoliae]
MESKKTIIDITKHENRRCTIVGQCIQNGVLSSFSNTNTPDGIRLSGEISDKTGTIRIVAFGEEAIKNVEFFQKGNIVAITQPVVLDANNIFNTTKHKYVLKIGPNTIVKMNEEMDAFIWAHQETIKLDELKNLNEGAKVDVIGICSQSNDLRRVYSQKKNKEYDLREIRLIDETNTEVMVTLWEENAKLCKDILGKTVYLSNSKIKWFKGELQLSTQPNTQIIIDPIWNDELRKWYFEKTQENIALTLLNEESYSAAVLVNDEHAMYKEIKENNKNERKRCFETLKELNKDEQLISNKRKDILKKLKDLEKIETVVNKNIENMK